MRATTLRDNLRRSLWHGAFFTASTTIISTFFPLYFIDSLHASAKQVGLLNALPALGALLASILLIFRLPQLPRLVRGTTRSFFVTRLSYVLLALAPWLSPHHAAEFALIVFTLANIPQTWGLMGWQTLIGHLIPASLREGFFSQRNVVTTLVALGASLFTGLITQFFSHGSTRALQVFIVLATVLGVLEVMTLGRHQLKVPSTSASVSPRLPWRTIIHNGIFLRYALLSAFFNFGWQMSWPLFNLYQIGQAHATAFWLGIFSVMALVSQAISFPLWRKFARHKGAMTALGYAALGLATVPWLTILTKNLVVLSSINFEAGLFLSGVNLLLFTELQAHVPAQHRSEYIVVYNIIIGAIAFIAPEFGIWALSRTNIIATMQISALWRAVGGAAFLVTGAAIEKAWVKHARQISR
ncbi:MFS transporter [Sulfobacillus thermosulfidooxidans]|uniref:MFS transporter n=1 Tax=Sulfobacillus thermosulfidooxidans TaxID=28034 RepID=UPI0002ED8C58|nr:MFS transporter [Sulfobacillus thermosulfidooxidans]